MNRMIQRSSNAMDAEHFKKDLILRSKADEYYGTLQPFDRSNVWNEISDTQTAVKTKPAKKQQR